MEFMHKHDVVHRDIKGLNVLTTESGRIKVCDFGFSEIAHHEPHGKYLLRGECWSEVNLC